MNGERMPLRWFGNRFRLIVLQLFDNNPHNLIVVLVGFFGCWLVARQNFSDWKMMKQNIIAVEIFNIDELIIHFIEKNLKCLHMIYNIYNIEHIENVQVVASLLKFIKFQCHGKAKR